MTIYQNILCFVKWRRFISIPMKWYFFSVYFEILLFSLCRVSGIINVEKLSSSPSRHPLSMMRYNKSWVFPLFYIVVGTYLGSSGFGGKYSFSHSNPLKQNISWTLPRCHISPLPSNKLYFSSFFGDLW